MSAVKAFKRNRRIPIPANVVTPYYPSLAQRGQVASAVVITNKTTVTLYVSESDRPDVEYDMAIPAGSSGPMVNPEGINQLFLYGSVAGFFDATEVSTDQPDLQFQVWNMQFVATSPLPTGYNIIGRTITQNAAGDIAAGNPLHVTGTGAGGSTSADVTDRAARALGKAGLQVAGADVAAANPVPIIPGTGVTFDLGDRAARALGKTGLQVAGADVAAANPVPMSPGAGVTFDVGDRAARALGKTGLQVAGADVGPANPVPVKPATGIAPVKTNAAAPGEQVIKATPGRLFAFIADVAGTLRNGAGAANDVWVVPANTLFTPQRPLEFGTSIIWNASAAGNIYTQFE